MAKTSLSKRALIRQNAELQQALWQAYMYINEETALKQLNLCLPEREYERAEAKEILEDIGTFTCQIQDALDDMTAQKNHVTYDEMTTLLAMANFDRDNRAVDFAKVDRTVHLTSSFRVGGLKAYVPYSPAGKVSFIPHPNGGWE
ncbi:MAG: hypothetical protein AB7O60_03665 [Variibacter sp.]